MSYPIGLDEANDYYAHMRTCTDGLCRTYAHTWARTTMGRQFTEAQLRGEQEDRERRAMVSGASGRVRLA